MWLLTQTEFEYILGLEKIFETDDEIIMSTGAVWHRELVSVAWKEKFILDFRRNSIEIKKCTINKRYKGNIVLLRYDSLWTHTNPHWTDEETFTWPHVHIYHEDYWDRIAYNVSAIGLDAWDDINTAMEKFLSFCNVTISSTMIKRTMF